ncbi:MAG TPA: alpha/beta fold hydrolase [Geobacteraceae bacterium]
MEIFVGIRTLRVIDEPKDIAFPVLVMYPTRVPSAPVTLGPFSLEAALDAPIDEGTFPLVVVSHGSGGYPLLYRTIGACLAKHGYAVALPEHPGNNRDDNALNGTVENLVNRPRHIRLTIDAVSADAHFEDRVQPDNTAIIGHSMGGYTALAVAGGEPWTEKGEKVEVKPDGRVKALVLLAPATAWFMPEDALRNVTIPILLLVAEHDPFTPRWQGELVLERVPDRSRVTCRVIENAGHFSFLSPFPPAMRSSKFPPSVDPAGFDRERFHEKLNAEVLAFLDGTLRGA